MVKNITNLDYLGLNIDYIYITYQLKYQESSLSISTYIM